MPDFAAMPTRLSTERLRLRPWRADDVEWHARLVTERDPVPAEPGYSRGAVDRAARAPAELGFGLYVLERCDQDAVVGYCGLVVGRATAEEPELAYELFRDAHGRGYATEAAREVVAAARETGRLRLWSTVRSWNTPSLRVLEKLGFRRDRSEFDERGEVVWNVLALG